MHLLPRNGTRTLDGRREPRDRKGVRRGEDQTLGQQESWLAPAEGAGGGEATPSEREQGELQALSQRSPDVILDPRVEQGGLLIFGRLHACGWCWGVKEMGEEGGGGSVVRGVEEGIERLEQTDVGRSLCAWRAWEGRIHIEV